MGVFCWLIVVEPHPVLDQLIGHYFPVVLATEFRAAGRCIHKAKVEPPSLPEGVGFLKRIENENDFYL